MLLSDIGTPAEMAPPFDEVEQHPVIPNGPSRDGKLEPRDPPDSMEPGETSTDSIAEQPSVLFRSIVVSSLMLATFLVGLSSGNLNHERYP